MTPEEYAALTAPKSKKIPTISIEDLKNKNPRTLLWGYNHRRESHHVYIADDKIYLHVYLGGSGRGCYRSGAFAARDLVPDKRLYPEACDAEFCNLLNDRGIYLPFTSWHIREPKQYYGNLHGNSNGEENEL